MKGTTKIAVVVALAIVIIGGSFVAKGILDNRAGDDYYIYLDGMGDINGWYSANSDNAVDALEKAMSEKNIDCAINHQNGWLLSIDGHIPDSANNIGYGIFEYTSISVESPSSYYFFNGPTLANISSNIVYISYGSYTIAEDWSTTYSVNPGSCTDAKLLTAGPFAEDAGYKPLKSSHLYQTYYFYLDGMGDINGWYSAKADNVEDAFKYALEAAEISYNVTDSGWIVSIGDKIGDPTHGFSVFGYFSTEVKYNAWVGYFFNGPVYKDVASNVIYISYGEWDASYQPLVNPGTCANLNKTGPFAE